MRHLDARSLGLIVVTTGTLAPARGHRELARAALEGGATAVQLRAPELPDDELLALAVEVSAWCREADVLFVVNDRVEVARAASAGVHLGQDDHLEGARQRLGRDPILGISVRNAGEVRAAALAGADYVGATVWSTASKPEAEPIGPDGIADLVHASGLPVVGIGGIDAGNAAEVLRAGAAGVAVISAVAAATDPVAATRGLRAVVDEYRKGRGSRR